VRSAPVLVSTRPTYVAALDGIRLLAVLLVILHHLTRGSRTSILLHLIGLQRGNGIGPTLFFVLSGVLLTTVILAARNTENRYRNFLLRRVLRIFPLYFAYLIVAVAATWIFSGAPLRNLWVFAFFLQNTFVNAAATTGSVLPMYHLWTLAVQDQFYLFWPLLLWKCDSTRRMRYLCYSCIALSFLARVLIAHSVFTPELLGRTLPSRAGEMCLGALIALESRERTIFTPILRRSLLPLSLSCAVWMWFGLDITTPAGSVLGLQLIALACAALIAAALTPGSWTARALGSRYIALGGKQYAFAMYIFHPLMLNICVDHLGIRSKAIQLAVFGIATVLISHLSYRYIESPFLHLPIGRSKVQAIAKAPQPVTVKMAQTLKAESANA
jgi:peptidoglycan/LPS O-acetylase OafA/YrhL